MFGMNEHDKKLNEIYTRLNDLKEGKRLIENLMHKNFYNRVEYARLFEKVKKINAKIKETKEELEKEKKNI